MFTIGGTRDYKFDGLRCSYGPKGAVQTSGKFNCDMAVTYYCIMLQADLEWCMGVGQIEQLFANNNPTYLVYPYLYTLH